LRKPVFPIMPVTEEDGAEHPVCKPDVQIVLDSEGCLSDSHRELYSWDVRKDLEGKRLKAVTDPPL
jgi:hypothetical protein